jgi:hypothetical protein
LNKICHSSKRKNAESNKWKVRENKKNKEEKESY